MGIKTTVAVNIRPEYRRDQQIEDLIPRKLKLQAKANKPDMHSYIFDLLA